MAAASLEAFEGAAQEALVNDTRLALRHAFTALGHSARDAWAIFFIVMSLISFGAVILHSVRVAAAAAAQGSGMVARFSTRRPAAQVSDARVSSSQSYIFVRCEVVFQAVAADRGRGVP